MLLPCIFRRQRLTRVGWPSVKGLFDQSDYCCIEAEVHVQRHAGAQRFGSRDTTQAERTAR
jgi:hypothetical protein